MINLIQIIIVQKCIFLNFPANHQHFFQLSFRQFCHICTLFHLENILNLNLCITFRGRQSQSELVHSADSLSTQTELNYSLHFERKLKLYNSCNCYYSQCCCCCCYRALRNVFDCAEKLHHKEFTVLIYECIYVCMYE